MSEMTTGGEVQERIWDQIQEARSLASPYRIMWDKCLAYVANDQYPNRTPGQGQDNIAPASGNARKRKARVVVNQLLNIRRHVVARLATDYPAMAVLPASDTNDDIAKSTASEEALRYFWQQGNMRTKLRKACQSLADLGTVALRTRFDTKAGDVVVDVVLPYDLYFEPYSTSPEESDWVAVCQYSTKEALLAAYPDYADQLEEYANPQVSYYAAGPQSRPKDRYALYDVYFKSGRHEVWTCNHKVFESNTPASRVPVQVIRYTEVDGYLWGMGLIQPLLDVQDRYNDATAQIRANTRLVGNPKTLIPDEAEVDPKAFNDQPGEKIKFKNGASPSFMAVPPLPQNLTEEPARALSEMFDISGMHGTSLGKRTAGLTSGVAIQTTSQNDAQQLQLTQDAIEDAVKETAIDVLCYMREFYKEDKMVRMLDTRGRLVWSQLAATNLVEDPEIFFQAGSLFRSEAQDREAKALQLMEAGLMTPEDAKKHLTFRTEPTGLLKQLQGLRNAQELLEAIKQLGANATLKVYPTDDLDALEKVFGEFLRTPELYLLPQPTQDALDAAYSNILGMINPIAPSAVGMPPAGPQTAPQGALTSAPNGAPPPIPGMADIQGQAAAMETEV